MQKFFKDTVVSSFIKEFVYSQNIPSVTSATDGDFVVKNICYIYKNNLIKITKSGKLNSESNRAEYEVIRRYAFNEKIPKITENFASIYNYYDPETHYNLGRYLRLLRDCKGIDLMPFYNCFNYKIVNDVYLGIRDEVLSLSIESGVKRTKDKKIVLVPIRFGKKYTICIESFCGFRAKPILYGRFGRIINWDAPEDFVNFRNEMSVNSSRFNDPVVYDCNFLERGEYYNGESTEMLTDSQKERLKSLERYLYLLIQLPINNNSSILVQEGDYTNLAKYVTEYKVNRYVGDNNMLVNVFKPNDSGEVEETLQEVSKIYSDDAIPYLTDEQINNLLLSELQLQRMNTGESYPFSTRLVEYLLDNVITRDDEFGKDIQRVQESLNKVDGGIKVNGVWSNEIRGKLFRKYISNENMCRKHDPIDINGFIDRDSEDYLYVVNNRGEQA